MGVEGSFFIVQLDRGVYQIHVLNTLTPEDWSLRIRGKESFEVRDSFLFLREDPKNDATTKCLWFYKRDELKLNECFLDVATLHVRKRDRPKAKNFCAEARRRHQDRASKNQDAVSPGHESTATISKEALRKTLLDLLNDDAFFDQIYNAYEARTRR